MSQQDNFGSGFLLGTLFGGLLGGAVGAVVASRITRDRAAEEGLSPPVVDGEKRSATLNPTEEEMETARRGLEDKIAQLNTAIDDVRQRLGSANGHSETASGEPSVRKEG